MPQTPISAHPLEPLTRAEIERVVALVRADTALGELVRFSSVCLHEPSKERLVAFASGGDRPPREAFAVLIGDDRTVREAVVDLTASRVAAVEVIADVFSPILPDEYEGAVNAVRASAEWQAAMRKRGIEDLELVQIDILSAGAFGFDFERDRRAARGVAFRKTHAMDNAYARPIEGVLAFVDLDTLEVFRVDELFEQPIPDVDGSYHDGAVPQREAPAALEIVQPAGVGFELEGHRVRWQGWSLRVSIHPVQGLVLHTVGYDDGSGVRPIVHRAAVAEMIVPYAETSPMHDWRNYFDAGEYGLGRFVNSLELGCDCLGEIRYLDANLISSHGGVETVRNAICLHEEDAGMLWKHADFESGHTEVRRSRRLVVSSIYTVGNYDYGFYWHLYQDGSIEAEVKLTGIVSTIGLAPGEQRPYSEPLAELLGAPNHQHLFSFRLDLDVDGTANRVLEVEAEAVPQGPENPRGNAFRKRTVAIRSEAEGRRESDVNRHRVWRVESSERRNAIGQPTAYHLVPLHGTSTMLAHPESSIGRRATYAQHALWVTAFDASELHAAGDYPYQHPGGAGLPAYVAGDRPLIDTDIVLWYTVGVTHFVRTEDWPVMPVERCGFMLRPSGFFDRNPSLDVPPPPRHCR